MFEKEIESLRREGLFRSLRETESPCGARIVVDGKKVLNLSSNNYLGLADHPAIKDAAIRAVRAYGVGTGASPLISGHTRLHRELVDRVARLKGAEAALIFNTGYMANVGTLSALLTEKDTVWVDRLCHASLIDGCRMSGARLRVFAHRDAAALSRKLSGRRGQGRTLIVTDGVFSMDGDLAPLPALVEAAEAHGATLMLDDAHATGVLGKTGGGTCEHFGMKGAGLIQMGTLSKGLGGFGAYVAASRDVIDLLVNRARSFIYATAVPAAVAAAGLAALDLIEKNPEIRERLWENREYYARGLKQLGFDTLDSETPILPVLIGENEKALKVSRSLWDHGIFAPAIRPPTVPRGTARLRTSVMATHTRADLDHALEVLGRIGKELGLR